MSRAATAFLVVLTLALVAVTGFGWTRFQAFESRVASLQGDVERLGTRVDAAEAEAVEARLRADEAEEARRIAEADALAAEGMAAAAQGRELEALAKADEAAEARRAAEDASEKAAEARKAAEEKAQWFESEAKLASLEARDAKKEAERLRRQRELELDRLQGALAEIAETRRSALGVVMNLGDSIEFDFDRAELRPDARELLSRIAGVLATTEGFRIQVFGHTDDVGNPGYNLQLSEKRAEAVRAYLVEAGVDEDIISMKGYGKSQPLVVGTTEEARQRNRRVEIAVTHSEGEVTGVVDPTAGG